MEIELNKEFQEALDLLENSSSNIFITGKAGTGKSTLLHYFLSKTHKNVVVLAPTGVAALNVQGETIHSFFKFKPGISLDEAQRRGQKVKKDSLYHNIDLIVIDEISMVRADLLDCVDGFLQKALKNKKNFGNIRMVFIGDLYQLSPVVRGEEKQLFQEVYNTPYFFSGFCMKNAEFKFIELMKIYRQKDSHFIELLNAVRRNTITEEQLQILNERVLTQELKEDAGYIYLTATNKESDQINTEKLSCLSTKLYSFMATIDNHFEEKNFPCEQALQLKEGAQVMFLTNHSLGLWVNGSIGKVVELHASEICVKLQDGTIVEVEKFKWPLYEYEFDKKNRSLIQNEIGSFHQYPLKLAWSITIHKSQGKTFDKVILDVSRAFATGQTYVALSRCRTLEGLILKKPLKKNQVMTDYKVVKYLTSVQYALSEKSCPIDNKIEIIQNAIKNKKVLNIVYLKAQDEKSSRSILPQTVGEMTYQNKTYLGVEAFCFKRKENRVFRVDRILEISSD